MAKPLTDDERQAIADLLHAGHSRASIARTTGRGVGTIDRIAKSIGFRADQSTASRTQEAREARSAYSAERRAKIAARLTEAADKLLDQLEQPHLAYNFGGRDNTYEEHQLAEPPVEAKRQLIQAAREALRTVLDIDRHDNRNDEGLAAVDAWLRDIVGEAAA